LNRDLNNLLIGDFLVRRGKNEFTNEGVGSDGSTEKERRSKADEFLASFSSVKALVIDENE
jgi:hypothetical protein